jgi:hypothetical protein
VKGRVGEEVTQQRCLPRLSGTRDQNHGKMRRQAANAVGKQALDVRFHGDFGIAGIETRIIRLSILDYPK